MLNKICYTKEGNLIPCIKEDQDCNMCGTQEVQKQNTIVKDICGFSMGAAELRQCIHDRCKFWIAAEQENREIETGMAYMGVRNEELIKHLKDTAQGYCVFEVIARGKTLTSCKVE
jgi:hypothetical protein